MRLPRKPVSTYSIVAFDADTGQLGVAVQSHWFSVGTVVPWAESGVGAVATQALAEPAYGPHGLELMRNGVDAVTALAKLTDEDSEADVRQVAFVDASGRAATHTGARCIDEAGHVTGEGFTVQANMMARPTVWAAMAGAYAEAVGDLADRLLAALDAAEAEGGDIRGRQSAALLVVSGESTGNPGEDRLFDLRVEDHPDPLDELRRLVQLRRAYIDMTAGDDAIGAGDVEAALDHYSRAARRAPEVVEMPFWQAVSLAAVGRLDEAAAIFAQVFEREPVWRELVPRLVAVDLLPIDDDTLDRIIGL
ncbi:MAG: DUF1028 domain-containing protein [Acidimicrobiia bacterium]